MTTILHSKASEGARHPCFNVRYATIAARDAFVTASDADVGKRCVVTSPLSEWLLAEHTAGVPRWALSVLAEWPAVDTEVDTGIEHPSLGRIYMVRKEGTTSAGSGNDVIWTPASSVTAIANVEGWINDTAGENWIGTTAVSSTNYAKMREISGAINLYHAGNYNSAAYKLLIRYCRA